MKINCNIKISHCKSPPKHFIYWNLSSHFLCWGSQLYVVCDDKQQLFVPQLKHTEKVMQKNLHSLFLMATDRKLMKATTANREKNTPMKRKNLSPFSQVLQKSCRYMTWVIRVQSANTPEGQTQAMSQLFRGLNDISNNYKLIQRLLHQPTTVSTLFLYTMKTNFQKLLKTHLCCIVKHFQ